MILTQEEFDALRWATTADAPGELDGTAGSNLVARGLLADNEGILRVTALGELYFSAAVIARLSDSARLLLRRIANGGAHLALLDAELVQPLAGHGLIESRGRRLYATVLGRRCVRGLEKLARSGSMSLTDLLRDDNQGEPYPSGC